MKAYNSSLESAFDQSTQAGRLAHFRKSMDPMNFFNTEKTLKEYRLILKNFDSDPTIQNRYSNEEIWRMKYCLLSNTHPQTEEVIPYPFRTSAFVLANTPISFGLAVLPPTPFNQIASQSINQTFNFCFNYYNRNVSNVYNTTELAMTAAIVGSLGTAALSRKITFNKTVSNICLSFSPYMGVSIANVSKRAFWETAASRVIIPIPVFLIPIGGIKLLKHYGMFPKGSLAGNAVSSGLAALGLWVGGTIGFSMFEQNTKCHVSKLEASFHNLTNQKGNKIQYVQYNKGL